MPLMAWAPSSSDMSALRAVYAADERGGDVGHGRRRLLNHRGSGGFLIKWSKNQRRLL